MRGPFNPDVASDIVTLLREADPSEWLASAVFVMTALPDASTALNRLASERTNLPDNIVEILELRSLTDGYGLVWLDENAQRAIIEFLRSGTTTECDIIRAMSLESVRLCAATQFARLAKLSDPNVRHNDAHHSNAQIFAQAAIAALIEVELDGMSAQLVEVREKLGAKRRDSKYDRQ
jgi:exonuclease I